jgi:anti-anti-sigma factor
VNRVRVTRNGTVDTIEVIGEFDVSNVESLDKALEASLSRGATASCLLDLTGVTFMDSSVVNALVRWSKETQISEREGLAILVGGPESPAIRVLELIGLAERLPLFTSLDAALAAIEAGKKPRGERPLRWLTDLELASEREQAQAGSDAATRRLDQAIAEQDARQQQADGSADE